jgi:hypothetical protein
MPWQRGWFPSLLDLLICPWHFRLQGLVVATWTQAFKWVKDCLNHRALINGVIGMQWHDLKSPYEGENIIHSSVNNRRETSIKQHLLVEVNLLILLKGEKLKLQLIWSTSESPLSTRSSTFHKKKKKKLIFFFYCIFLFFYPALHIFYFSILSLIIFFYYIFFIKFDPHSFNCYFFNFFIFYLFILFFNFVSRYFISFNFIIRFDH